MGREQSVVIVVVLLVFYPALAYSPAVTAQDDMMEFVMAYPQDLEALSPLSFPDHLTVWYNMLVYDTLLSYDDNLTAIPWLAESFSVRSDGLQVNFTLREGAYWHDGQPVTPDDVKFTFELIRDGPSHLRGWAFLQHVTNIEIFSHEIVITLDQVNSFAIDKLGSTFILPKHIRQGISADNIIWNDPNNLSAHVGSGMFRYVERSSGEYILLDRFDDWWGPDNPHVGQLPNIDRVRIDIIIRQEVRIMAMRNGDVDTERYEVSSAFVSHVLEAPELQLVAGVVSIWEYFLGLNTKVAGLDDFEVRKAIAYAIDREELINIGRLGFAEATKSIIPEAFYPSIYHLDGDFPEQNVTIANQILDDAGWVDTNMNGIRDNGLGVELSFELLALSWDDASVNMGTGLKLQLEEIGFEIDLVSQSDELLYPAVFVSPRSFEMLSGGLFYPAYPDYPYWRMHSDYYVDWSENFFGWSNSTLDSILEDYISATPSEFFSAARAVQVAATENMPYIPIFVNHDTHALRAEWTNFSTKPGGPFTIFCPETMVFMYDSEMHTAPTGSDPVLILAVGAGAFAAGVVLTCVVLRRRYEK
ncbi:MAG: ABC transporter substrate-binding protein [Candidatus Thorarchaeota archaeon]